MSGRDLIPFITLLCHLPGVFAAVYSSAGRYEWVCEHSADVLGLPRSTLVGRTIESLFPSAWCKERLALIRDVCQERVVSCTVEIYRGRRMEGLLLPIAELARDCLCLYAGRHSPASAPLASSSATLSPVHLVHADWGPLESLSRRELEVLRFVSLGLDNTAIAKRIFRTKRAVEWHINSLYRHLGTKQRLSLARLGIEAGLPAIEDAHWDAMIVSKQAIDRDEDAGPDRAARARRG
ncbi:helix-turn-helix transcriptional regulator [Leptolyngbya sp. 15MV]|nr:helix-turn-helix transcriptional regulator [Leptolyngbya sp. 15MV]